MHTARLQAEDARFRLQNLREDAILRSVEVQVRPQALPKTRSTILHGQIFNSKVQT